MEPFFYGVPVVMALMLIIGLIEIRYWRRRYPGVAPPTPPFIILYMITASAIVLGLYAVIGLSYVIGMLF